MSRQEELIAELDQARAVLRRLLDELKEAHATSREVYPTWTVKELLAHMAGWDDANIASVRAFLQGDTPLTPAMRGIDPYNASTVSERDALPIEHVIAEWEATREEFKSLIRQVPDERLNETFVLAWGAHSDLAGLVHIFSDHEREHAADMEQLIKNVRR